MLSPNRKRQVFMDQLTGRTQRRAVWTIVTLVGVYVALQLITDVTAAKIIEVFGLSLPAGTFLYAVTFTWRDLIHKRLGTTWARASIVIAAVCNVVMAGYFAFSVQLTPAGFWSLQDAYASILAIVPRIVFASILAEVVTELVDTEVYRMTETVFTGPLQVFRAIISNTISTPLDGLLFGILAFAGTMPWSGVWGVVLGSSALKLTISLLSAPLIYLVKDERLSTDVGSLVDAPVV